MIVLAIIAFVFALIPCALFMRNLRAYRAPALSPKATPLPSISVLIPARNEEANIAGALESVLAAGRGVEFEVIVLDDHSTDRTAAVVNEFINRDSHVRLEAAPSLPPGWCGKQHACAALAERARFPLLVFMDADVRLAPNALARMATFLNESDAALASGIPRQVLGSFWEKLLIPLIHFVLLGFLPLNRMRRSTDPAYAAGCGQLFMARADAYRACGGHGVIRASLHDGLKLPRVFREHGFKTDLFDATEVASCRMYARGREVFAGLAKNAVEGLASPARIIPATLLLAVGQVLPFVLMLISDGMTFVISACAAVAALAPRVLASRRFSQPLIPALLHPFAIVALLLIQWFALFRSLAGSPSVWRGRAYAKFAAILLLCGIVSAGAATNPVERIGTFQLKDQYGAERRYEFPRTNVTFVVVADHKGSEQLESWIRPIFRRYGGRIAIEGVADVSNVPAGLRGMVQRAFVKKLDYSVMLDWSGDVARQFKPGRNVANVFVLSRQGKIVLRTNGGADERKLNQVFGAVDALLIEN